VAWRLPSTAQTDDALVFPRRGGGEWHEDDWNNWRNPVFRPALTSVGLPATIRPATCASRRPASGCTKDAASSRWPSGWVSRAVHVARHLGHVVVDLSDGERRSAEDEIRAARGESVSTRYLEATGT
jgi:hypothetical protein